jgi:EpsI family protein
MLPTGPAAPRLPARVLTAANADRTDQILYWTRIGEAFPDSGREQRLAKLRLQLRGIIPDGVLVRFSNITRDRVAGLALNARFARALLAACPISARIALAGSTIGKAL